VVVTARIEAGAMGLVGWLEGSVYMGLLFVAGSICILNLLGARLVPGRLARRAPWGTGEGVDRRAREGPEPDDREAAVLPPQTRLPGLFNVAEPLLRLLAGRARRKGIDK
jgi:hypothetical protein